ncbi:2-amino-3-carboxymuconate-6-semialdehyde decarboxylase [Zancudomyces culisetae]|uniref:2-amino-3-carboxymuconate-6-semialdehyde decarboxylase n=1 Tax=Zancudomyces culisetae TaxID=1213189 RepID=A0A1R1PGH7_ZANCU|nr:2-amino-3-carboxymuconate-6-semialdehyde decarboxylase [Zancudomyces culisetae]|eukprot:OMH80038.1 2-amino-3-carboxymuconate-6-semialdehyde decarboxylase [Zancudomyces culisetae]
MTIDEKDSSTINSASGDARRLVIDFHTHILPREIPDFEEMFGYGGWIKLRDNASSPDKADMIQNGRNFRTIDCNCWRSSQRIHECDRDGVDVQVISTIPVMFSYWAKPKDALFVSQFLNDHIAQCVSENPKRFIGLGTIPMQDPELAVREMHRCVKELGLSGFQIGSHVNNLNLDAPEFEPIWSAAEELNTTIFIHPWDMDSEGRMSKYWFPWLIGMPCETTVSICSLILGGVYDRHPNLKVVFAHGGGSFPGTMGRIFHGYECRPDLVAHSCNAHPESYLPKLYFDSLVHDEETLEFLVKKIGVKNIVLGSDYPFPLGEDVPGKLVANCTWLSEKDKQSILAFNALHLLGLDPSDYF